MKKWTDKEIEILKNNYETLHREDLCQALLDRTWHAIKLKAHELNLCYQYETPEQRFWRQVNKKQSNGCWNWAGSCFSKGHGQITINKKTIGTHRFSWEIHFGKIPKDLCVLHTCDNPPCVNPSHLFLGTQQDNMHDMVNKNRQYCPKGENNNNAKLTANQVKKIKQLCSEEKLTQKEISKLFNISNITVSNIYRNKIWKHIK